MGVRVTKRLCKNCGKSIPKEKYRNTFCSQSCASSFNNRGVKRHFSAKEKNHCCFCGNETFNEKYCNSRCHADKRWENTKKEIELNGRVYRDGPYFNPEKAKRYLKERFGAKCLVCGNDQWMGKPIPLMLDHIDGNGYNWIVENLRMICGNCNMQTKTYKGRNRSNGRYHRKVRYDQGNSY